MRTHNFTTRPVAGVCGTVQVNWHDCVRTLAIVDHAYRRNERRSLPRHNLVLVCTHAAFSSAELDLIADFEGAYVRYCRLSNRYWRTRELAR